MRAFLAASLAAALGLLACGGCTSTKMPSLPTFGFKSKSSKTNSSQMTNAPPAPQLNAMAGAGPAVSMPHTASWSNLPVYPGTTYQQTPYPEQAMASAGAAPGYSSYPPAVSHDPASGGYAPSYGAMPPSVANNSGPGAGPYAPYPATGGEAPPHTAQQASPYPAQQAPPYAPQQAPPYAQQQAPPAGPQQAPYAQQPAPYGQQPDPYNAANPYGSYTR